MLTLAHTFKKTDNVLGWWMSEKFDGERVRWTGHDLYSRAGHVIHAPREFLNYLPKQCPDLDGELFMGRGNFKDTGLFRRKNSTYAQWTNVVYQIFDTIIEYKPFEARQQALKLCVKINRHVKIIRQVKAVSQEKINTFYKTIIQRGGEGVMFRQPASFYERGRSKTMLKLKPVDVIAGEIIGYNSGKGKYTNMLGSFSVRGEINDTHFIVNVSGMSDAIRRNFKNYPLGTVVSLRYSGLTHNNVPRFPRLVS